jgi:hypothetical protein
LQLKDTLLKDLKLNADELKAAEMSVELLVDEAKKTHLAEVVAAPEEVAVAQRGVMGWEHFPKVELTPEQQIDL